MSRRIKCGHTKAERQAERRKLGRLDDNIVSTTTETRYKEAYDNFVRFTKAPSGALWTEAQEVDSLMCTYIEQLWEGGEPKSNANYTIAAVQFFHPQLKKRLIISVWNKLEQPCRATPLDAELTLSVAGIFMLWQWPELAYLCVVGFSGFLRTGELFKLRRKDVVLATQRDKPCILFLADTKTSQRSVAQQEKVLITDQIAKECLKLLCRSRQLQDPLTSTHPAKFRSLWKEVMHFLKLDEFGYTPYSLRRGGATSAYKQGASLDELLLKGRWKHQATARIYLDQGLQELASLSLPAASRPRLALGTQTFQSTVSQKGARGDKSGTDRGG